MIVLDSVQNTNTDTPPTVDYFKAIKNKKINPKTPTPSLQDYLEEELIKLFKLSRSLTELPRTDFIGRERVKGRLWFRSKHQKKGSHLGKSDI